MEDLVRYVNTRSNNFCRNRDLKAVFKRFAGDFGTEKVLFDRIVSILTK